jgi:hypothetical protein
MIKELTKSNKYGRNFSTKKLKSFLNQTMKQPGNLDNSKQTHLSKSIDIQTPNRITYQKEKIQNNFSSDKLKDSSYLNDQTDDTTQGHKSTKFKGKLNNYLTDSKSISKQGSSPNLFQQKIENKLSSKKFDRSFSHLSMSKDNINNHQIDKTALNKSFSENSNSYVFYSLVQTLEMWISEIKTQGFGKYKVQIEEKLEIKQRLEISVENLHKRVNFVNSQKKHFGTQGSKLRQEMFLYKQFSDVSNIKILLI